MWPCSRILIFNIVQIRLIGQYLFHHCSGIDKFGRRSIKWCSHCHGSAYAAGWETSKTSLHWGRTQYRLVLLPPGWLVYLNYFRCNEDVKLKQPLANFMVCVRMHLQRLEQRASFEKWKLAQLPPNRPGKTTYVVYGPKPPTQWSRISSTDAPIPITWAIAGPQFPFHVAHFDLWLVMVTLLLRMMLGCIGWLANSSIMSPSALPVIQLESELN